MEAAVVSWASCYGDSHIKNKDLVGDDSSAARDLKRLEQNYVSHNVQTTADNENDYSWFSEYRQETVDGRSESERKKERIPLLDWLFYFYSKFYSSYEGAIVLLPRISF